MFETALYASLLNEVPKISAVDGISTLVRALTDRARAAEQKLENSSYSNDSPMELYREQVIRKITQLRNRAALCVGQPELQQKIWCLLMEQTISCYEANTRRSLDLANTNAEQIEAALDTYDDSLRARRNVSLFAVLLSIVSLAGLGVLLYIANQKGMRAEVAIPILGVPTCVLLWSVVGSFAAILYRFTHGGDLELDEPLRWLFSRPLMGVIMGAITFLIIRAGFLTMSSQRMIDVQTQFGTTEVMWLVAFLAGFSDRFSDMLLRAMVGRFAGQKDELGLVRSPARDATAGLIATVSSLLERPNRLSTLGPQRTSAGSGKRDTSGSQEAKMPTVGPVVNGHGASTIGRTGSVA
jgi:hypothetical protein